MSWQKLQQLKHDPAESQWTITLLSHISLYTTVLVFLHSDQFQERKYMSIKEEKIKVQHRYRFQWRKLVNTKYKRGVLFLGYTNEISLE